MASPLLRVEGLSKSFGGILATDELHLDVSPNEIHAIIGPNGAGKTTLIAQLTGALRSDAGRAIFDGVDITRLPAHRRSHLGIARSFQITSIFQDMTNLENVALAVQAHAGHSFRFWRPAARDPALSRPAMRALERVGLDHRAGVLAANCSHGEHRQLEIAMALATRPRLLLLDEPMAGMGPEESAAMIAIIRGLRAEHAILLVEHDMDAVFTLADRITVLVYGRAIVSGTPAEIRANREVREAYLGEQVDGDPPAPAPGAARPEENRAQS